MSTEVKPVTFDRTAVVNSVLAALLPLIDAIDSMPNMDTATLTDLSFVMHAIDQGFGPRQSKFDKTLRELRDAGKVTITEDGIRPVRKWRDENAAKPGRKAVVKTEAEKLAESLGVTIPTPEAEATV